jgi:hypothetical protein
MSALQPQPQQLAPTAHTATTTTGALTTPTAIGSAQTSIRINTRATSTSGRRPISLTAVSSASWRFCFVPERRREHLRSGTARSITKPRLMLALEDQHDLFSVHYAPNGGAEAGMRNGPSTAAMAIQLGCAPDQWTLFIPAELLDGLREAFKCLRLWNSMTTPSCSISATTDGRSGLSSVFPRHGALDTGSHPERAPFSRTILISSMAGGLHKRRYTWSGGPSFTILSQRRGFHRMVLTSRLYAHRKRRQKRQ